MKIWTVLENTACRENVTPEHGLSLYIETGKHRILFDAGQSDAFLMNARAMGVDLSQVDTFILSHGHYDHGGGLPYFLRENSRAKIYVNEHVFGAFYHGTQKYIGLPEELRNHPRLQRIGDSFRLDTGLTLCTCNDKAPAVPVESYGLNVKNGETFTPDDFVHEQYLLAEEQGKKILISGCSHKGIVNIVNWFHPDVLVGGFHFKKLDPEQDRQVLKEAAERLLEGGTRYYTCHCTGVRQYEYLKTIMGDRLQYLACGSHVEI